ncbi:zinc finger protein 39-like [Calliphora vicina]|uniref:zinc finger protein 39-like n=1 Tax=Calliphora vicina TaxID=7373 RepID=UPI00325A9B57
MSSENTNENPCRICLKTNVFFDWTEAIFEFSGPSYKECYYQYTHLQEHDEDVYTQMLCLDCGNCLRNTYQLVGKALESDIKLKEMKTEITEKSNDPLEYVKERESKYLFNPNTEAALNTNAEIQELDKSLTEATILVTQSDEEILNDDFTDIQDSDSKYESDDNNSSMSNNSKLRSDKVDVTRQPLLCAYCSRIFYSRTHLTNHEKTHDRNRERTESCPICGLQFFNKMAVKSHMPVHDENRVRNYKCEFCIKAFFSRGGLNIHRRIHLGQMIKCNFCSKEFFRQNDLERHMQSHEVSPLTANTEKSSKVRAKYFMECKTCERKINKSCWETHKAKHLNQPLLQCGICNKTYYTRKALCLHIKKIHDVSGEEYDKAFIVINKKFKPRHSSLMKKQNITIE